MTVADAPVERFNILDLLKEGTADIHVLIEQRVPVFREDFGIEDYEQLVESFFGFWGPVEEGLSKLAELKGPELALQSRFKCSLLREDLLILGRDPASVRRCDRLPRLDTFAQGIGCLYVMEGSTLGSQIISRRLAQQFQLDERSGAAYFNAYGAATGSRWMEFKRFLSAAVRAEDAGDVVGAARDTFICFYEWLGSTKLET